MLTSEDSRNLVFSAEGLKIGVAEATIITGTATVAAGRGSARRHGHCRRRRALGVWVVKYDLEDSSVCAAIVPHLSTPANHPASTRVSAFKNDADFSGESAPLNCLEKRLVCVGIMIGVPSGASLLVRAG